MYAFYTGSCHTIKSCMAASTISRQTAGPDPWLFERAPGALPQHPLLNPPNSREYICLLQYCIHAWRALQQVKLSELVAACKCEVQFYFKLSNRLTPNYHFTIRPARDDIIITTGGWLQAFNPHNSSKAAICSDELTSCNARHRTATATPDSNNAKQWRISQERERVIHICGFVSFGRSL